MRRHNPTTRFLLAAALALTGAATPPVRVAAQLAVRPADPLGLSIREARVRVIHSDRADPPGSSLHLQQTDPWLAYQRGRSYFFREWNQADGVFQALPNRPVAAAANSCGMCHNRPFRSPGAGGNYSEVGYGRNIPHLFGVGLMETLAIQIRQQILARCDKNGNGFIDVPDESAGQRAVVEAVPGTTVDFGSLDDEDGDGRPDLNDVILTWPVRADGTSLVPAGGAAEPTEIAGYDFVVGVFSNSVGDHQFPTLRQFVIGVANSMFGIAVDDPTSTNDRGERRDGLAGDGWCETSNAAAPQPFIAASVDRYGAARSAATAGDTAQGLSEGELDLFEWYLLNHPAPAVGRQNSTTARGRCLLDDFKCTRCHVADWRIQAADERRRLPGDRRFFDLQTVYNEDTARLEGRLVDLRVPDDREAPDGLRVPARGTFLVEGIFTDFRHHDVGPRFYEYEYLDGDLYVLRRFRTPPLWGVGSSAPYGHDGRDATLDQVIRRHGGDAADSTQAYATASVGDRLAVLAYLKSLVLFSPDLLPADIDGDGKVQEHYVAGAYEAGPERFWPELLFRVRPHYRGWLEGADDPPFFSYEMLNVDAAYGNQLPGLRDEDRNQLPDLLDTAGNRAAAVPSAPATSSQQR